MTNTYAEWIELKDRAEDALRRYPVILRVASGNGRAYKRDAPILKAWNDLVAEIRDFEEANRDKLPQWQQRARAERSTPTQTPPDTTAEATEQGQSEQNTVPTYPSLNIAFLRQNSVLGRLWYLLRYLDDQGRGIVSKADAQAAFCDKDSELYAMTRQRLGQVLREGDGVTWRLAHGNIYLFGAAKTAVIFGVDKLRGANVAIPVTDLLQGQKRARAAFWATVHAGRRRQAPIARVTLRGAFGLPESTQRSYDEEAATKRQLNIVIIPESEAANYAYTRKRIIRGREVLTAQLPSSYTAPYEKANHGRKSKINKRLKDSLVSTHRQGNVKQKLYFDNEKAAHKAANKGRDALYRAGSTLTINVCRKTRLEAAAVWEMAV